MVIKPVVCNFSSGVYIGQCNNCDEIKTQVETNTEEIDKIKEKLNKQVELDVTVNNDTNTVYKKGNN